jgi:putative oxidoreductase
VLSVVEPLLGIAIILGIITEWAALILAIDMIGAMLFKITGGTAFIGHQTTGWEFDLTVFAANVILLMHGPGRIALDRLWKKSGNGEITTITA